MSVYIFEELSKKVNIYVLGTSYSGNEIERRDRLTTLVLTPGYSNIPSEALEAIFFDYYIVLLASWKETKSSCAPFLLQYINLSSCSLLLWFLNNLLD